MSHFSRFQKESPERLTKDGGFYSGDDGGKDAGAGAQMTQPSVAASPASHMHDIADRHQRESDLHSQIAQQTSMAGMDARSGEHQAIAGQHQAASVHYRNAANAASNGQDTAPHLKQARAAAGQAAELTKCGMS